MPLVIGLLLISIYYGVVHFFPEYHLGLFANKKDIAAMVLSFAFTMLGFLAAMITLLFGFADKEIYKKFKRNGHLQLLFFLYYVTIFSLVLTAFFAMFGYSESPIFVWPFRAMLVLFATNIVQVTFLTVIISNFSKNADN